MIIFIYREQYGFSVSNELRLKVQGTKWKKAHPS